MTTKFVHSGKVLDMVAPGTVTSGVPLIIGSVFGIPEADATVGEQFPFRVSGVNKVPKLAGFAPAKGTPAYWDVADVQLNNDSANPAVGFYETAPGSSATEADILITGAAIVEATALDARVTALELIAPNGGTLDVRVDALEAIALNGGTLDLRVDALDAIALNGGTLDLRVDALDALCLNGGTLDVRVDTAETDINALEASRKKGFFYTFTGAGDQVNSDDTSEKVFTKKATIPTTTLAAEDWVNIRAMILVDNADTTPEVTFRLKFGSDTVDTQVVATAAANDYVVLTARLRLTAVGASSTFHRFSGEGVIKDGTNTAAVPVFVAGVTGDATTSAIDVTCSAQANAGHANNLYTIYGLEVSVDRAS
jgi:predicted RecA/RadA family phage recombinase